MPHLCVRNRTLRFGINPGGLIRQPWRVDPSNLRVDPPAVRGQARNVNRKISKAKSSKAA